MAKKKETTFEAAIGQLEEIIRAMEGGDLELTRCLENLRKASGCSGSVKRS